MAEIHYYLSVMSPFTYLAGTRLETLAAKHAATVRYLPVDIARLFGETGGTMPKDRHPSRQRYRLADMERTAAFLGMPMTMKPAFFPVDTALASHSVIAAQAAGFSVGVLAHAFTRAVWAEDKNIADPETVSAILEANGVAAAALEPHMEAARGQFQANTDAAIAAGVFGAPSYVVDDQVFWGGDRLPHLDAYLGQRRAA